MNIKLQRVGERGNTDMKKDDIVISKLYDRAGLWETKSLHSFARGDFDKAGRYRKKSLK